MSAGVALYRLMAYLVAAAALEVSPGYLHHGTDWLVGNCASRDRQSPVSLDSHLTEPPTGAIEYRYLPLHSVPLNMRMNGGVLYVDIQPYNVGGIMYNSDWYPLVRINFHVKSEHVVRGKRSNMEVQLVHRKKSNNVRFVVLSLLVWSEFPPSAPQATVPPFPGMMSTTTPYAAPNPFELDFNKQLQHFLMINPPFAENSFTQLTLSPDNPLNLNLLVENPLFPASSIYIRYVGSMTSPPCTDKTTWLVRRTTLIASASQIQAFSDAIRRATGTDGNFREVMPLNQRQMDVQKLVYSDSPWTQTEPTLVWGPNPYTDLEFKAQKAADKVLAANKQAAWHAHDLAMRLSRSEQAFSDSLTTMSPPMMSTTLEPFYQSVNRVRDAISGAIRGVAKHTDATLRGQVIGVHTDAANEASVAEKMVGMVLPTFIPPGPAPAPAPAPAPVQR